MSTIKRGRDIKGRNSSHCKLLKYAKGMSTICWAGTKTTLVTPKQRIEPRRMCTLTTPQMTHLPVYPRRKY